MELFHCFGARPEHRVDTRQAVDMLAASGCRWLAVNTHTIDEVSRGDDLPIGYSTATLGSVRDALGAASPVRPVLNINHPTTAAEAIDRTRRAVEMTGLRIIKLEVLDEGFNLSQNAAVVEAATVLVGEGLEVWPLITPDAAVFADCVELGSTMVRVMGSPIGARRGIDPQWRSATDALLADATVPVMLDGGVGSVEHAVAAAEQGFSSILVNSCLFADGDPVAALREFRAAIDSVEKPTELVGR
ncbi:thiazole synthase [Micromonospora nigra]|uniref:thiazole synthase n=1 Tax=Micromonospora nigra TaxID=145857 RepID=A0A1C6RBQ2_9ACTN|nr:hypothetical protein [Micromonospora nigra]SCL14586.1 thiazole synthase [Micromonospora nigra]